jgi:2-C-methyl-D-erythritol 4-phosphate cytidylyltransferase
LALSGAIWAIVPAAGVGTRMQSGIPKQYLPLSGKPVLRHTLERLTSHPRIQGVLLGIAAGDTRSDGATRPVLAKFLGTYTGGASRAETVLNGLRALPAPAGEHDWALVHDAVRPCVRHDDIDFLLAEVGDAGGLLALPMADTVKRADPADCVTETVPRAGLWRALTPQLFPVGLLTRALEQARAQGVDPTDEAAAVERLGLRPRLVAGHPDNIKITLPRDLALAELFLRQQEQA